MSAVLESPGTPNRAASPVESTELPDARVLVDRTPVRMRTTSGSALLTLTIGIAFLIMANARLWHTDLWDHLNYGQQILATGTVSSTEPLLHLCRGVPMVNIPWLAQVGLVLLNNAFGLTALQFAVAVTTCGSLALIAWRTSQRSHSVVGGLIAIVLMFKLNLDQFLVIRPQLPGVLFYCILVAWCFGRQRMNLLAWTGLPLLFAVWANVHGSFSTGLLLMALSAAGRFGDVLLISRSPRMAFCDRQLHRLLLLLQLCGAAVLLNPAGLAIYPEVFHVAGNPNISSMFEWDALTIRSPQGQFAAAVTLLVFLSLRFSPRRLHCGELLAFVAMGMFTLWSSRMVNWWAPVAGLVAGIHCTAALRKAIPRLRHSAPREASGLWTVVNLGILWIVFALTPFGMKTIRGRELPLEKLVSSETPVAITDLLNSQESLPAGPAFIPAEWAGYVMNRGPAAIEPMVNLHVHVIPVEVWNDYLRLIAGSGDWAGLMDEYGINLAVIDKARQPALLRRLQESPDWQESLHDRQAAVFVRKRKI